MEFQKMSQGRVKQWPNTLEAERKRKEARRQEKLDREEDERKKIDREEAAIAGEKRRMAIERANKMLYDDSDKVKAFHSNLLLSDVLKERTPLCTFMIVRMWAKIKSLVALHSLLNNQNVLQEREAQIEVSRQKKKNERRREK